mmetsp:Transcript_48268/g.142464  ORF Transcript_48268/g.142464 Transcript_48268/m.142464 type:complete len:208 (+) Transcript_48268:347-970(+)
MKPRSSASESWHCCTASERMASTNFFTSRTWLDRCFSSAWFPMCIRAFSTESRSGAFALSSSWSSSSTRLFAMLLVRPCSSSSSCFARASAFSLAIIAAFFSKATVSNMFGMTVQQTRRKYSTSTSPLPSGQRMLRIRWICIRERQSWSALSSTLLSSQMDMMGSWLMPKRRQSRMRWVRSCWTSVSTSALWSESTLSFCSSSTKSS